MQVNRGLHTPTHPLPLPMGFGTRIFHPNHDRRGLFSMQRHHDYSNSLVLFLIRSTAQVIILLQPLCVYHFIGKTCMFYSSSLAYRNLHGAGYVVHIFALAAGSYLSFHFHVSLDRSSKERAFAFFIMSTTPSDSLYGFIYRVLI
jgi:hypothetical protein